VKSLVQWWSRLGRGAQLRFVGGFVVILAFTIWLGVQTLRTEYDVLFSRLSDADAAAIVDRLRQLKIPYHLADDGTTVEVPAPQVHEVRLKLMSDGVPLSGGVGFEIFDKQGLGATEQSQRVSYQRALQGELARTISTLSDVKQARVHLVLPESTLFKRDRQEARAAVTLTTRSGSVLSREQILGVQRLVAASVAGLDASKVVVTDQRGITLSGADSFEGGAVASEGRLSMKRDIEDYVTRKVARLLDSTYGPGQAIVSVDVALNFDEIHRTVQDLEPATIKHRRQVYSGSAPPDDNVDPAQAPRATATNGNSTTDVEYESGRRVEQVIAAPGGITRISVGVVVPGDLSQEKQERITELVRMAAGINAQRGDAIVVQPLDQLGARVPDTPRAAEVDTPAAPPADAPEPALVRKGPLAFPTQIPLMGAWLLAAIVLAAVLLLLARKRLASRLRPVEQTTLSVQDRQLLLLEIEKALGDGAGLTEARVKP
jgi:flagellar M-ring protein FliF